MRDPIVLKPDTISTDVVECAQTLHEMALRGEMFGIGFVAMVKHRGYIVNAAGEAYRNPTFTIGMCHALIMKLSHRLYGGNS